MKITLFFLSLILLAPVSETEPQTALSEEEIEIILERHNYWRADVGVLEKLEWSDEMAELAADWAKQLKANDCGWEHRPNNKFGENLFKGTTGAFDAKYVVDAWASEKEDYNYNRNKCKPGKMCGHYTQIVWQTTKKVGCAKISCGGMDIWVCNYDPPGNWVGEKPY
ncbi:CAP domain-containing protein [Ekhidna sp.]|uniref:CAP domain-containing protein n=1 Tax=Ekhidna sp. TaxID=2608089 RepID=UPI0032978120